MLLICSLLAANVFVSWRFSVVNSTNIFLLKRDAKVFVVFGVGNDRRSNWGVLAVYICIYKSAVVNGGYISWARRAGSSTSVDSSSGSGVVCDPVAISDSSKGMCAMINSSNSGGDVGR